jgi:hypothetical protein
MAGKPRTPREIAALLEIVEKLRADNARLAAERDAAIADRDAQISELARGDAKRTRLKTAALTLGVHYEAARRWCERGFVESARRQGGLWLVDIEDLRAVAIARMLPVDQKRSILG